jgi:hypothetical protein
MCPAAYRDALTRDLSAKAHSAEAASVAVTDLPAGSAQTELTSAHPLRPVPGAERLAAADPLVLPVRG